MREEIPLVPLSKRGIEGDFVTINALIEAGRQSNDQSKVSMRCVPGVSLRPAGRPPGA
jgi:hypothetical protein